MTDIQRDNIEKFLSLNDYENMTEFLRRMSDVIYGYSIQEYINERYKNIA